MEGLKGRPGIKNGNKNNKGVLLFEVLPAHFFSAFLPDYEKDI